MKIALCISGQPRSIEENFKNISSKLLGSNVDVFVHTWFDEKNIDRKFYQINGYSEFDKNIEQKTFLRKDTKEIIQDLYKPKSMIIEKQKAFIPEELAFRKNTPAGNEIDNPYRNKWFIRPQYMLSMFYSIMKSNSLKKEYELQNSFIYDCVIRCRFDLNITSNKINFNESNMDLIHLMRHSHCSYSYHDVFGYSNSKNMDTYSDLFKYVDNYYHNGIEFCPEIMLGWHIINNNIKIKNMNFNYKIVR